MTFCKNFDFNLRRDHQKDSNERRNYESVDKKEPILGYIPKNDEKRNLVLKGLMNMCCHERMNRTLNKKLEHLSI